MIAVVILTLTDSLTEYKWIDIIFLGLTQLNKSSVMIF
jgi:hypothetical protein